MTADDTQDMNPALIGGLKPWQHHVIGEANELDERMFNLAKLIESDDTITDHDKVILVEQLAAMDGYLAILNQRIGQFIRVNTNT